MGRFGAVGYPAKFLSELISTIAKIKIPQILISFLAVMDSDKI